MTAAERGWGPGWPTDRRRDMVRVTDGNDVALYVHRQIGELVALLLAETERRGYRLHGPGCHPSHPQGECWGYANRSIRGRNTPSEHSWGLAVDLNAPSNPMTDRLVTDMPRWMVDLWERFGFRWGGRYQRRPDAMHYEFMGTPADAARMTALARRELVHGTQAAGDPPPPPRPRLNAPVVGSAFRPQGDGSWDVTADGGVWPFGNAPGLGSLGGTKLNAPVVGIASTPSGNGYWLAAADGGVWPFGDAEGLGSMGGTKLNHPIVAIVAHPAGGYHLKAADGGTFPFGAPAWGSIPQTHDAAG